jgi:Peptidase family M28
MKRRFDRIGRLITLFGAAALAVAADRPSSAEAPAPDEGRLRSEVVTLASPEYAGRRGDGARKTAAHLVAAFHALKLEPLFDGQYEQPIPGDTPGQELGRNVGARLVGSDPVLRDDWIIVSAHYDHLGVRAGVLYPGADDNASGVAMMLEVARALVEAPETQRPRRSVMFIGFDLEEVGLFGSRYFVEHTPVPLGRVKLFITADMIGRSLAGVCARNVFVMGSEHAPSLRPWIEESARGEPIQVGLLGSDMLVLNRSDYGPFRARKVPYLFFSTGENPLYHSPKDLAETLDYDKLAAITRLILGVVRRAVAADAIAAWSPQPEHPMAEAVTIRDVLKILLEHRASLKIPPAQTLLMTNTVRSLDAIVARGEITPSERSMMVNVTRIVLFSLF